MHTPNLEGYFTVVAELFYDALFTINAGYEKSIEHLEVNTIKAAIFRLLGLQHENSLVTNTIYDSGGNLTNCVVKCYDSKINCLLGGVTGLIHQYSMTATYSGPSMTNYTMVRDF